MRATVLALSVLVASCGGGGSDSASTQAAQPSAAEPSSPTATGSVTNPAQPTNAAIPPAAEASPVATRPPQGAAQEPAPIAERPAAQANRAPTIKSVGGPSSGAPGELVTLEVEWSDADGDASKVSVKQVAGNGTKFTVAGNLLMFEVPDVPEGAIVLRVLVSDGKATTTCDYRFHVLAAADRYSIHRVPDTLGDDRVGTVRASVINNDGHVGGTFEWEAEGAWEETDAPWPNSTGVIWLDGASSLIDVNEWFHSEPLLHIGGVNVLSDDFKVAGTADDFGKTNEDGNPSLYNYTWNSDDGLDIFWQGRDLSGDGRLVTQLTAAAIAPNGDVIGFDGSDWTTMFRWDGDAVHFWCYRDARFPETASTCPATPGFSETECIASVTDDRGVLYEWEYTTCPSRYTDLFENQTGPFGETAYLFVPEIEGQEDLRLDVQRVVDMNDHDALLVEGCLVEFKPEAAGFEPWWQSVECGSYVLKLE